MDLYKKKYKEALERMKSWARGEHPECFTEAQKAAEFIFPELKENEDERIRKAIISGMTAIKGQGKETFATIRINDCIAWLEKQGEQKPQGKTALEAINEEKVDNSNRVEPKDYNSIDPHFGKPADKVEPKFHEGDWVVNRFGDVWHIDSVDKKNYQVSDRKGNYNYFPISKQDEMHLWTIQDAKDGDVVIFYDSGRACIFKHIHGMWYSSYCFITKYGEFHTGYDEHAVDAKINCNAHPATKEQRDTLEKAMADAGYTFDFEKKELKKIKDETSIAVNNPDSYKIGFADGEAYAKEQQWKPSDGQMEVLKGLIDDEHVLDAYKGILKGLQEQLKKLK